MITVGITLGGSLEELTSVLEWISARQKEQIMPKKDQPILSEIEPAKSDQPEEATDWTEQKISSVYWNVSYDCRRLLKIVANNEAGISTFSLGKMLGVDEHGVGGILSSLGRQLNQPGVQGLRYPMDYTKDGYRMKPIWRDVIAKIVKEQETIVKSDS